MPLRGRLLLIRTHSNHNGGRSRFFRNLKKISITRLKTKTQILV